MTTETSQSVGCTSNNIAREDLGDRQREQSRSAYVQRERIEKKIKQSRSLCHFEIISRQSEDEQIAYTNSLTGAMTKVGYIQILK